MRGPPKLCQPSAHLPTRPQTGPQASTLSGVTDTVPTLITLQQRHPKTDFFSTEPDPQALQPEPGAPKALLLGAPSTITPKPPTRFSRGL